MRLIDADELKAITIEEYRVVFFGSVLWNILDDLPTITKDDIRAEVIDECIQAIYNNTDNPVREYGQGVNDCIDALEQLKEKVE